ncbi:MAG: NAD(P)/FAD-dependent oxidoreductase [Saprospiraceae bacterium]|nr:NAD(P)/FAD-dependent oxidoreductase [Saprospiraceae bacterium]
MKSSNNFDVIIIGGSYSGLAAGMALGRSLKQVLIIDGGMPCNIQTPYSHNFLTQDGRTPLEIAILAKCQVGKYNTIKFYHGLASKGVKTETGFEIQTESGEIFKATKLIFATGIKDIMPEIAGYAECWGISVLHCPYCHGYEVRNEATGILGNGEYGLEFSMLISNWTKDLTLYSNGKSTLTQEQTLMLEKHNIKTIETPIEKLEHTNGRLQKIVFKDGTSASCSALYVRNQFEQNCSIPTELGCELTQDGYIMVDAFQKTSAKGIFACGDNTTRMRTVANAVAMGTTAGISVSKELVMESFQSIPIDNPRS